MNLQQLVSEMDAMVLQGQVVEAVDAYFGDAAVTRDFDGTVTADKAAMLEKMRGFAGAIAKVNGIKLHHSAVNGSVSMSEFTFDFDMKDGSKVLWHEIIRRVWQDGKVINEQYFKN